MSDLDTEQKPPRRLWMLAAVGALALHVAGAALAVAHLRTDDDGDGGLGAAVTGYAVELSAPSVEETDLPAGPDTEASTASAAVAEQKAVPKETDLPKDQ